MGRFGVTERWWDGSWYEARGYFAGITLRFFCLYLCMFFFPFPPLTCYHASLHVQVCLPCGRGSPSFFSTSLSLGTPLWSQMPSGLPDADFLSCSPASYPSIRIGRATSAGLSSYQISCDWSPACSHLPNPFGLTFYTRGVASLPRNVEFWERCRIWGDRFPLTSRLRCSSEHC